MVWFPFEYMDTTEWRRQGLSLSTTSDEAAKYLDSTLTHMIFCKDTAEPYSCLMKADPDCIMGKVLYCLGEVFEGYDRYKNKGLLANLTQLANKAKLPTTTPWEKDHIDALICLEKDDLPGSLNVWDSILLQHPNDILALHFSYFAQLHMGRPNGMRNSVLRILPSYKPHHRFYGNVHGKLSFALEECNQFDVAVQEGLLALNHTDSDAWSIHSLAHINYETLRHKEGISFLEEKEDNWMEQTALNHHIVWHKCLHYIHTNQNEEILTYLDDFLLPGAIKEKSVFKMSDVSSLLLRLQILGVPGLKSRWKEIGAVYSEFSDSASILFYDLHTLFSLLFSEEYEGVKSISESLELLAEGGTESEPREGWNSMVASKIGINLAQGLKAYANQNYDSVLELCIGLRHDVETLLGGSRSQKDIFHLILVSSALKAGQKTLALQLLEERTALHPGIMSEMDTKLLNLYS